MNRLYSSAYYKNKVCMRMNNNPVVTAVLFILVFLVGFGIGRMSVDFVGENRVVETTVEKQSTSQNTSTGANSTTQTDVASETTVSTDSLTDGQKQMLSAMGIDAENITITAEMVACAEAKLGSARIEEIKNGASPSFTEGATLVACYR
jgi:Na+-transporting methylmalonyl-CoA/oxaloacetate decarboxylase gamma subunit